MILLTFFYASIGFAQHEVAFLRPERELVPSLKVDNTIDELQFPFQLARNLIWIEASVEGVVGYYILDTGAPTLLLNDRGQQSVKAELGLGAGGTVPLAEHHVESFELGGVEHGTQSAYHIDLRPLEARAGRPLQGMVGHKQLSAYELLIDYPTRTIRLFPAKRNELHQLGKPKMTFRFTYIDHLPIITLTQGKRKLNFILDTGAGSNLIHQGALENGRIDFIEEEGGRMVNIQGLDGELMNCPIGYLNTLHLQDEDLSALEFVSTNLDHIQAPGGGGRIDGILGTDFLQHYRISIDFHKRRLHFW